jgi:hypothetical protein
MNKWDCIKIKSTAKEIVPRLKRQPSEREKISASCSFDKGILSILYKELKKLNPQRINLLMNKWAHEFKQGILKGRCTSGQ